LRDEPAFEGALQDGLAQPRGARERGVDARGDFVGDREAALDLGDDAVLLGEGRERNI
jgi:hypothetical protein